MPLAESFNAMAARLKRSFDDLVGEVETRKSRERELKESEARLRSSEERLQLAIDAASLGIWDWDVEQDRLVWDELDVPALRRSQGRIQRRFRRLVEVPRAGRRRAGQGGCRGGASRRARVRRPTSRCGEPTAPSASFAAWGKSSETRTGEPVRMVGINRDVTDLINAEREREQLLHDLRRSASYLAEAEKLSHTGCWARNTKTGEVFWSPEQWRIFGLDPATTQLSHQLFVDLIHPEDRAFVEESNDAGDPGQEILRHLVPRHAARRDGQEPS